MAQIYGELIRAQLQSSATDLSPTATGLVYFNTSTGLKWHTGSGWKIAADLDSSQTLAGKTLDATCSINVSALPIVSLAKGGLGADASAWSGFLKISAGVASAASISASDLPIVTAAKGGLGADASAFTGVVKSSSGVFSASTIVNADVSASAAIAGTKISPAFGSQNITTTGTLSVASELISGTAGSGFIEMAGQSSNPSAPSTGVVKVFAKNDSKVYKIDSLGNVSEIGSGSGSGINYLADYFLSDVYCNSATSDNVTNYASYTGNDTTPAKFAIRTTTPGTLVQNTSSLLRGANSYLFTPNGAGTFMAWPTFTLQQPDIGKAVSVSFDLVNNGVDGDFDVVVQRYNSSGTYQETIPVAGNASSGTPASAKLPTGTKSFNGFFISSATVTDTYRLMIRRLTAGTTTIAVDTVVVGPNQVLQGAIVTDWSDLSQSVTNLPIASGAKFKQRRVGSDLEMLITFQSSASSSTTEAYLDLPSGLTIDTNAISNAVPALSSTAKYGQLVGYVANTDSADGLRGTQYNIVIKKDSTTRLAFTEASLAGAYAQVGQVATSGYTRAQMIYVKVPISQWSANTQQAARAVEEYAFNTNTSTTVSDTTSFGYGPQGVQGVAITVALSKRVRFQTPILPTDLLVFEYRKTTGTSWQPIIGVDNATDISFFTIQNAVSYGVKIQSVASSSTDIDVSFGTYAWNNSTYGAVGIAWPTTYYWRVRKVSSGAAVGFPIAPANITLIDNSDNYGGNTKLGFMKYLHGTTYNGGNAPTVTGPAGFANVRSIFIPYQMSDGTWRLRFNIDYTCNSLTTVDISVAGVTFNNAAACSAIDKGVGTVNAMAARTTISSGSIVVRAASAGTNFSVSGDAELSSKPTWAY